MQMESVREWEMQFLGGLEVKRSSRRAVFNSIFIFGVKSNLGDGKVSPATSAESDETLNPIILIPVCKD